MKKLFYAILCLPLICSAEMSNSSWIHNDSQIKIQFNNDRLLLSHQTFICEYDLRIKQTSFYGDFTLSRPRIIKGNEANCNSFVNSYRFIESSNEAFLIYNTESFEALKLSKIVEEPIPDTVYNFDELLPDPFSAFTVLRPGGKSLINNHVDPRTGGSGLPFPNSWSTLPPYHSVRLKILIPPGVNLVSWYLEAPNLVAHFGTCNDNKRCVSEKSYPPTIHPFEYNPNLPDATPIDNLPALTAPKIAYITVNALTIDFTFFSLSVSYNVKDRSLYEQWRSQRNWAGGTGDCDGMGGIFCPR